MIHKKIFYFSFVFMTLISLVSSNAYSQTIYPELESILSCSQLYMKSQAPSVLKSKKTIIISGTLLNNCEKYKDKLNNYVLVVEPITYEDNNKKSVHTYLINIASSLGDNEIATLKEIAKINKGYSLGYLTKDYDAIMYFTNMTINQGVESNNLTQSTISLPYLRDFIPKPRNNLILDIHLLENLEK